MRYALFFIAFGLASCAGKKTGGPRVAITRLASNEMNIKDEKYIPQEIVAGIRNYYQKKYSTGARYEEKQSDSLWTITYYSIPHDRAGYDGYLTAVYIPLRESVIPPSAARIVLHGDLDHDGSPDMVVSVHYTGGETGGNDMYAQDFFVYLNSAGKYELCGITHDYDISCCRGTDFWPMEIRDGYLYGISSCFAPTDMMCCPTLRYQTRLRLHGNNLVFYSKTKLTGAQP